LIKRRQIDQGNELYRIPCEKNWGPSKNKKEKGNIKIPKRGGKNDVLGQRRKGGTGNDRLRFEQGAMGKGPQKERQVIAVHWERTT